MRFSRLISWPLYKVLGASWRKAMMMEASRIGLTLDEYIILQHGANDPWMQPDARELAKTLLKKAKQNES